MNNKFTDKMMKITSFIESKPVFIALKHGLVMAVPFIITGCMCLVLTSFPPKFYQDFIKNILGGEIYLALNIVYTFTMGMLAMIMLLSVSYSYGRECDKANSKYYPFVASMAYYIFACDENGNISIEIFGYNWMFTAIVIALFSGYLLKIFLKLFSGKRRLYSVGADRHFNEAMKMLNPVLLEAIIFVIIRLILISMVGGTELQNIGSTFYMSLFSAINNKFISGLVFLLFTHVFWIFGIHGNNILNEVATTLMSEGAFSKSFIDSFVLMGGCGTCICLMIAIFLVARQRNNRMLVRAGFIPALFNISEIFVFGFPIILNPMMVIPFIGTPILCYLIASAAVWMKLIPATVENIHWTSPIIYSGIKVTGTAMGGIVQFVSIVAGVCLYIPFIKMAEKSHENYIKDNIVKLCQVIENDDDMKFDNIEGKYRSVDTTIRMLTDDLHIAMEEKSLEMYYQPQIDYEGKLTGCEALLRWHHPLGGFIYPPLIIALANHDGCLNELEMYVVNRVCEDAEYITESIGQDIRVSLNVTPKQLESDCFCEAAICRISRINKKIHIDFEITEQIALQNTPVMNNNIDELKKEGILFAMDDFGMGHSSLVYLQNNQFSIVKLDGSLVKEVVENENSQNIIKTIVDLSARMNFEVIAEYVENDEIREKLHSIGCNCYQGYLYSKPVPRDEFVEYVRNMGKTGK